MSHLLPRRTDESWQLELHRLHQDGEPLSTLLPATPYILHVRPDALERVEVQDAGRQLDDGQPVWVRIGEHADYAVTTLTCAAATAAGSARTRTKFKRTFRIASGRRPSFPEYTQYLLARSRPTSPGTNTSLHVCATAPAPRHQARPPRRLPHQEAPRQGHPAHGPATIRIANLVLASTAA